MAVSLLENDAPERGPFRRPQSGSQTKIPLLEACSRVKMPEGKKLAVRLDQFIAKDNDEYRSRREEYAFLNLSRDDDGIVYKPIWNGERPVRRRRRPRHRSLRKKRQ